MPSCRPSQPTYSNLLLVTDDVKENDTYLYFTTQEVFNTYQYLLLLQPLADPYKWLGPGDLFDDCSTYLPTVRSHIAHNNWTVTDRPYHALSWKVNYCLAEKGRRQLCKLQYSFPLIMLIIGFNLVKTNILCYMWLGIRDAPPLAIGDAIASFLHRSDPTTQGACLLTRRRAPALLHKWPLHQPEKYTAKRRHWGAAASARRRAFSIILWFIAIPCCILVVYGIDKVQYGTSAWKLSLGAVNATTLIKGDNWPSSLVPIVLIANMPQLHLLVPLLRLQRPPHGDERRRGGEQVRRPAEGIARFE